LKNHDAGILGSLLPSYTGILDPANKSVESQRNFPVQATSQKMLPEQNSVIQNLLDKLNPSTLNLLNTGTSMELSVSAPGQAPIFSNLDQKSSPVQDFACLEGKKSS
jgi:hypothetical protein